MSQDGKKIAAARAAIRFVEDVAIIGVGTGSTVNHFIDALADIRGASKALSPARRLPHGDFSNLAFRCWISTRPEISMSMWMARTRSTPICA